MGYGSSPQTEERHDDERDRDRKKDRQRASERASECNLAKCSSGIRIARSSDSGDRSDCEMDQRDDDDNPNSLFYIGLPFPLVGDTNSHVPSHSAFIHFHSLTTE